MAKYIPDISTHRWVIVSSQRISRPNDLEEQDNKSKDHCVFCPGHENETPPEVFRIGKGEQNKQGWEVRVVPNKYSITDFHEVIIHSPNCKATIEELPLSHIQYIFQAYRERFNFYRKSGQVIIFCNQGKHSGASLRHSHSQLVVIPWQINLDTLGREPINNIVEENTYFNVYCPDFSQWPYEVWIVPKKQKTVFGDITDEEIKDLVPILKKTLTQLKKIFTANNFNKRSFDYNFYIYPRENWYLRIIPRFVYRAGFELGTGLSVNIVDPIDSAFTLKGIDRKTSELLKKLKKHV